MIYGLAFACYLIYVFLRSLQQRHVQHAEYWRMPPISYAMAACDVFLMSLIVKSANDFWGLALLAFAMGSGSSMGAMMGTWLHARSHRKQA